VGNQTNHYVSEATSSVKTSYWPPSVSRLIGPHGTVSGADSYSNVLLNASGGEKVVIDGRNFGPIGYDDALAVGLTNPNIIGFGGTTFLVNCSVSISYVQMICTTPAGIGFNQTWEIRVGNQSHLDSIAPSSNSTVTSYRPPEIFSIDSSSISSGFATDGSEYVFVSGRNFGPSVDANILGANYKSVIYPAAVALSLETASYIVDCYVVEHDVLIKCKTQPGVGQQHAWTIDAGGQASAPSEDRTRYASPVVNSVTVVGDVTMDTKGGSIIRINGTNFPPTSRSAFSNLNSTVSNAPFLCVMI
jgi:hypothetical protein